MKKWDKHWTRVGIILMALMGIILPIISYAATDSYPALTGRVVDEAHLLSFTERTALENRLAQAEPHQVVAVSLASLRGQEIEEYGVALGRHWGIGRKDENDGVLIMIAPTERQMRIEVGYGLEGTLTDALASEIIRRIMLPLAKQGKYGEALIQGSNAVIGVLTGTTVPATQETRTDSDTDTGAFFSFFITLLALIFVCHLSKKKMPKTGSKSQKEIKKIIANCKVPTTEQEKELSRKDRVHFFWAILPTLAFYPPCLIAGAFITEIDMAAVVWLMVVICYGIVMIGGITKMYKKNPYFPFQEFKKHYKPGRSRGSGWSSGGSSFRGGGGSFGGGGSSGRW